MVVTLQKSLAGVPQVKAGIANLICQQKVPCRHGKLIVNIFFPENQWPEDENNLNNWM
jgi:hypothetical protein